MNILNRILSVAGIALALGLGVNHVAAQPAPGGGPGFDFDPEKIQQMIKQRVMGFFRDKLVVTNDAEWNVIEGRLSKVVEYKMETLIGGTGMAGMGLGGNGGAPNGADRFLRGFLGFQPLPEAESLQKVIDDHGSKAETKLALAKYVEARKKKQAELDKAQASLRQVLSFQQEATLVLLGLLD
jgi:hypothetical protein